MGSSKIIEQQAPDLHCQFCSEKIEELSDLIEHVKVHIRPMKSVDVALQCAVVACSQTFDYIFKKGKKIQKSEQLNHFEEHIRAKHTKSTKRSCKLCGKKFFSYKCEHFIHLDNYDKHISISNCAKQNGAYGCEFCGKGFAHKDKMETHRKIHTNEKEFKCTLCLKSFHQKGNLETHQK